MNTNKKLQEWLTSKKVEVKRKAVGFIKYDYLVPGGPYEEQWDWDGFFMGVALSNETSSEAIYLKNWVLNYLEYVEADGYTPGLLTPYGIDRRLNHVKPFLAQGVYLSSKNLNDFDWIKPYWGKLKKSVLYREYHHFDKMRHLAAWHDGMESGADNNPAVMGFPDGEVLACDLNSFLYLEYLATSKIAESLKFREDEEFFLAKAKNIKACILKYLWDEQDKSFFNLNRPTGEFIRVTTYSNILPLFAGIAPKGKARAMIEKYVLHPDKLWSEYGMRSLSKDEALYNNLNVIKPYSNWQGPVWPIANYFCVHALLSYGFKKEARDLATKITALCLSDLEKSGGMHENYDAETGEPLAAPGFISWNLLVANLIKEVDKSLHPFFGSFLKDNTTQ